MLHSSRISKDISVSQMSCELIARRLPGCLNLLIPNRSSSCDLYLKFCSINSSFHFHSTFCVTSFPILSSVPFCFPISPSASCITSLQQSFLILNVTTTFPSSNISVVCTLDISVSFLSYILLFAGQFSSVAISPLTASFNLELNVGYSVMTVNFSMLLVSSLDLLRWYFVHPPHPTTRTSLSCTCQFIFQPVTYLINSWLSLSFQLYLALTNPQDIIS